MNDNKKLGNDQVAARFTVLDDNALLDWFEKQIPNILKEYAEVGLQDVKLYTSENAQSAYLVLSFNLESNAFAAHAANVPVEIMQVAPGVNQAKLEKLERKIHLPRDTVEVVFS